MSAQLEPPRFARRLLKRALPADVRDSIAGDLEEVFRHRCESAGRARARLGYVLIAAVATLLSTAGIYALMSFTVSQRAREIGIRIALGAPPSGIVKAIFSRALTQLALGVVVGAMIAMFASDLLREEPELIPVVAALMLLVGLIACGVPAARALRIEPTEALKES